MNAPKDIGDLHATVGRESLLGAIDANLKTASYTQNDAGRAQQFVDYYFNDVRYVPPFNQWYLWGDSGHWRRDDINGIMQCAIDHSHRLVVESSRVTDHNTRAEKVKRALELGDRQTISAYLELAKCDKRIIIHHTALDGDKMLMGVQNGVVDLRTGVFRTGQRSDTITKRAGTEYVEGATCPRWMKFLTEVLREDLQLMLYMQKLVGYTLTGDVSEQCFAFLFGGGKNGKTVFMETLLALLGEYAHKAQQSLLTASNNGREPAQDIARLHGARLVVGSETEEGARLAESRVKDMTGGDTLTGRFLYAEAFDFKPQLKLWMFGNHKPEIRGTDEGIWRRVRLIPFTVHIPECNRDASLPQKLHAELPGILNWALEGTRLWLAEGLKPPAAVVEAGGEYREEEDALADFIADEIESDPTGRATSGDMYLRYENWSKANGFRFPMTQKALNKRLKERGLTLVRSNGKRLWQGVSLA